jgi:hypothetical protein
MFRCRLVVCFACFIAIPICSVRGENWPGWRGPRGDGTSAESNVPVRWNVAAPGGRALVAHCVG